MKDEAETTTGDPCTDIVRDMVSDADRRRHITDDMVDRIVEALCEQHGYGAVMDAAARLWQRKDPIGSFLIGPCVATARRALKEINDAEP